MGKYCSQAITLTELLDLEFRMRGVNFNAWAGAHGMTPLGLVIALEGLAPTPPEILYALEEELGVSVRALVAQVA